MNKGKNPERCVGAVYVSKNTTNYTCQHDNDPEHVSKLVKEWLLFEKIKVMDWPSQNPNINSIESMWDLVNRKIQ